MHKVTLELQQLAAIPNIKTSVYYEKINFETPISSQRNTFHAVAGIEASMTPKFTLECTIASKASRCCNLLEQGKKRAKSALSDIPHSTCHLGVVGGCSQNRFRAVSLMSRATRPTLIVAQFHKDLSSSNKLHGKPAIANKLLLQRNTTLI